MANLFQAAIYQTNNISNGGAAGQYMAFPSAHVLIRPNIPATSSNGVTLNSVIQLLPSGGLVVNQPQYYSDRTVAQLLALANA